MGQPLQRADFTFHYQTVRDGIKDCQPPLYRVMLSCTDDVEDYVAAMVSHAEVAKQGVKRKQAPSKADAQPRQRVKWGPQEHKDWQRLEGQPDATVQYVLVLPSDCAHRGTPRPPPILVPVDADLWKACNTGTAPGDMQLGFRNPMHVVGKLAPTVHQPAGTPVVLVTSLRCCESGNPHPPLQFGAHEGRKCTPGCGAPKKGCLTSMGNLTAANPLLNCQVSSHQHQLCMAASSTVIVCARSATPVRQLPSTSQGMFCAR